MKTRGLFLILFFFCAAVINGAEQKAVLKGAAPAPLTAQPFTLTFSVPNPPVSFDYAKHNQDSVNKDYEVLDAQGARTENTTEYTFTLAAFTVGKSSFTAVSWDFYDNTGEKLSFSVKSEDVVLEIKPQNTGLGKEMVDIRKPYMPFDLWFWFGILAGVLLGVFLFFFIRKIIRAGKKPLHHAEPPDTRTPEEKAREEVSALLASNLWEDERYKAFYTKLTDIFKEYLHKRLGISAEMQTSYEINRVLRAKAVNPHIQQRTREFLQKADLVKFAKQIPTGDRKTKDAKALLDIIDLCSPTPPIELRTVSMTEEAKK